MQLALSWLIYWLGLAAFVLGPGILAASIVTRGPKDSSSAGISVGDHGISMSVTGAGAEVWGVKMGWPTLALLVAGPPLLLWGLWLWRSERALRERKSADQLTAANPFPDARTAPANETVRKATE
jgi:threonine/homoserine/homoserine lactone efflux protein